jgi:FkbM family methyltransferase
MQKENYKKVLLQDDVVSLAKNVEDELFVYLDPGYTGGIGHYRNFAEKIHRYAIHNGIRIKHYVNKNISFEDKKRFDLQPVFNFNAKIDENDISYNEIEKRLDDFKQNIEVIFSKIKQVEDSYRKITVYMYTCHCFHIDLLTTLYERFGFVSVELHLVILQLNSSIINGEKNKIVEECLRRIDIASMHPDIYIYMDSNRAASFYQQFFKKKIDSLPIPLHHEKELKESSKMIQDTRQTISFFGYAEYKYGFHLFYEVYQYFSTYFKYIIRLNNKIHNPEFNDKIEILKNDKNVLFIDQYIDETAYTSLMKRSDIVVIPYLQNFYPAQTSGIFMDAVWHDTFVIATDNTWMADMIIKVGNGLVFENNQAESLILSVLLAQKKCVAGRKNVSSEKYKSLFTVEKMFEAMKGKEMSQHTTAEHEAYKEKDLLAIEQRQRDYDSFLNFSRRFIPAQQVPTSYKHILYPAVDDISVLEDLVSRLSFALPEVENISVVIPLSEILYMDMIKEYNGRYGSITYISEKDVVDSFNESIVLVHNMDSVEDLNFFKNALRVEIIDKEYFSDIEAETLRKLYYKTISPERKREYSEVSRANLMKFKKKNILKKQAFCFTTGPSFDNYQSFNLPKNALKIICNSIVKNLEFIDFIGGVDLITFGDPVFHFGPSSYAEAFREDVLKLIRLSEAYIVIPELNVPLMLLHYPELQDRLIGLGGGENFNFPSSKNFYIKNTANILTLFMLPVASAIADTIFIMGADGRKEEEKYFWQHSVSAQYNSNMEDAFKTHPSFFRDRNYKDYYQEHCKILEDLISYGESLGKVYASVTQSYIPALKERWIDFDKGIENLSLEMEERREKNREMKEYVHRSVQDVQSVNHDFAVKMNILYGYIKKFKESKAKIAIYGNGLIGQLIAKELKEQLIVIVDQNSQSTSEFAKVCSPGEIKNFDLDVLVITVLGREESIIKNIDIDKKKIYTIDLTKDALKDFRVVFIDEHSSEFLENNLCGPYTRESKLSLDETHLVFKYLEKNNGLMIDVGAHFGSSAKNFLENGWFVYGYEPDPMNREKLEKNLKGYENLVISDKALSNKVGHSLDFYSSAESTGVSSLIAFSEGHEKLCSVETTTLELELGRQSIEFVDFLKIDTEGYDLMVLQGYPWHKNRPSIIECEYEDFKTKQLGYDVYDTILFLSEKGYHVYVSEWHPIIRYGIRHEWKRFFKYDKQVISTKGWGNIVAFLDMPDEKKLVSTLTKLLHLDD